MITVTEQSFKIVVMETLVLASLGEPDSITCRCGCSRKRKHEYKTDFTHSCIVPKGCLVPPQIRISNQRLFEIKTLIYVVIRESFGGNMAVCGMSFHIFFEPSLAASKKPICYITTRVF